METPAKSAPQLQQDAVAAAKQGRYWDAMLLWARAFEVALADEPRAPALLIDCARGCGVALLHLGRVDDAIEWLQLGFRFAADETDAVPLTHHLASAYAELGEYQAAIELHRANVSRLERLGSVAGVSLIDTMQNVATVLGEAGELDAAAELLVRVGTLLEDAPPRQRLPSAANLAVLHGMRGNPDAADEAVRHCIQLAWDEVSDRLGEHDFFAGLYVGLEVMVEPETDVWSARLAATELGRARELEAALEAFEDVTEQAHACGDILTFLQCQVNIITCHELLGDVPGEDLQRAAAGLRAEALDWSLAPAAALADIALLSFHAREVEANDTGLSLVQIAVEALALAELTAVHSGAMTEHARGRIPVLDQGIALAFLGSWARDCSAHSVALEYFYAALEWAERIGDPYAQVNRLAGFIEAVANAGKLQLLTSELFDKLRLATRERMADDRLRLEGLLALGRWCDASPQQALTDLRDAAECYRRLRALNPTDYDVADTRPRLQRALLMACLAAGAPDAEAFEAVQLGRARELLDLLANASGRTAAAPPTAAEAVRWVSALPGPTTAIDLVTTDSGLCAFLVDSDGIRRVEVSGDVKPLRAVQFGDAPRRASEVIALTTTSPLLAGLVAAIESAITPGRALLICVDEALTNLPWHAVPYRGSPWAEHRSIGRIPALGVLGCTAAPIDSVEAVVAGDSLGDLPAAAAECRLVADRLGTTALLGADCTIDALVAALGTEHHDVVHLAMHGRADVRRGGRASLLFADGAGGHTWASFEELLERPWRTTLLVLSGCSTAVGGPRDGRGLAGIAQAAAAAGAPTVVASLWPVGDASTWVFMSAFYDALSRARTAADRVDLRLVMDHARAELRAWLVGREPGPPVPGRDGRVLAGLPPTSDQTAPGSDRPWLLEWASFVLIGDPVVRFAHESG